MLQKFFEVSENVYSLSGDETKGLFKILFDKIHSVKKENFYDAVLYPDYVRTRDSVNQEANVSDELKAMFASFGGSIW